MLRQHSGPELLLHIRGLNGGRRVGGGFALSRVALPPAMFEDATLLSVFEAAQASGHLWVALSSAGASSVLHRTLWCWNVRQHSFRIGKAADILPTKPSVVAKTE